MLKFFTQKQFDEHLRSGIDIIRERKSIIKRTNNYVWGKSVIRSNGNEKHSLETWRIQLILNEDFHEYPIDGSTNFVFTKARKMVEAFEQEKVKDLKSIENYTCYELYDWDWLEYENGEILHDGKITLVKYAIILPDINDELKIDRYTYRSKENPQWVGTIDHSNGTESENSQCVQRLCEYEDKIERGLLIELPCIRKVVADNMEKYHVYYIGNCGLYSNAIVYDWRDTYEQAEARLKELRGK